jgi:NitT/TauT family transport system substrate-binding protein
VFYKDIGSGGDAMKRPVRSKTPSTFAIALATLIAFSPSVAAQEKKLLPLKLGLLKQAALTNAWVAKREGIFERNGVDVDLIEFRNGNEAIAAQRGGHVDIVLSILGSAMTANERGFDLVTVMQNELAHKQGPDSGALIVLNDSGMNSVSDFAGKKIAVPSLHSQRPVSTQVVLRKHGVDPSKMVFLEMPTASLGAALRSRQIDIAATLDPWTTELRTSNYAKVLSWDYVEALPEQPLGAWYARRNFVAKNGDAVARFARSIRDAIEYMNADVERAKRNVADYTGLDISFLKDMPLIVWSYEIDPAKWQAVADMMHAAGELQMPHKVGEYLSDVVKPYVK